MQISPVNNYFSNISFQRKKIAVYALDENGKYQRFNSRTEAAQVLGVTPTEVNRSASKRYHRAGGFIIVNADKIETKDENGNIKVDPKAIKEILAYRTREKAIYALDRLGDYLKFSSQSEAAKELNFDRTLITKVISGANRTAGGYYFAPASEIESKDENGNIFVDSTKIKKVIENKPRHPIYVIDKHGHYRRFANQVQAAQALGISRQRVTQVIDSDNCVCNEYYIVPADEVESKDEEDKCFIDKAKIEEMLIRKSAKASKGSTGKVKEIYVIDPKGGYKKYNSRQAASDELGISITTINNTIQGQQRTTRGLVFIDAQQIEKTNEDGTISVDSEKIKEVLKKRLPNAIFLS